MSQVPIRTKFKQCGESSHRLVSCSRRFLSRYRSLQQNPRLPVSVETLVQANCRSPTSGGEAGAAVVRATGEGDSTTVTMSDTSANQASYPQHSNQLVGCGVGKSGGVVLCDNWSSPGSCDGRVYHVNGNGTTAVCHPPTRRCRRGGFCLWHVCGFGAGAFSKCRWRVS